jgi:hypothetical protein
MNQSYTLHAASPLLRPGLTISCEVSAGYAAEAAEQLLEIVREINEPPQGHSEFCSHGNEYYEIVFGPGGEFVQAYEHTTHVGMPSQKTTISLEEVPLAVRASAQV